MACYFKSVCCIDDVASVKNYLFGTANEEELEQDEEVNAWDEDNWTEGWDDLDSKKSDAKEDEDSNWLQKCHVTFSPTYDLLVIALGRKLVLLAVTSSSAAHSNNGSRRYKIVNQLEVGDEPEEHVTNVLCIPLVSLKKTSHGSVDWSCVVIGFSSGYIRIYTENGDQLISQLLHESGVIEIKCRTRDQTGVKSNAPADQPDEVTILYQEAVIVLEGFSLFQTLRACRSQVALATASGGVTIEPPPLSYKKWRLTGNQTSNTSHISPGVLTSNPFDQMRTASILGGFQAEIRGSAPAMSCFVTVGSSPYAGFYYAIEGSAQPHLSHVALAVASKLKSALYNSASRWLAWGTGAPQEPEQKQRPKVELGSPLDIRCGLPDPLRHGSNIVLAPGSHLSSSALAATTDSLGRVILMDVSRAIAVRMWKGYRDAQVGFMRVFDDSHRNRRGDEAKKLVRHALFLLIYAPRRGLLEVWTCVNGPRVGAFNVAKNARLLCNGFGMLGTNANTMSGTIPNLYQCCLVEANGNVKEVVIPFHLALSDANSKKARDMHLLKKLSLILHSKKRTGEEAVKLLLEMRISAMVRQGLEKLLHAKRIGVEAFRNSLTSVQGRLAEGGALRKPESDLCKYCEVQLGLIDLYESFRKMNDNSMTAQSVELTNVANVDEICNRLHMTRTEAEEGLTDAARYLALRRTPKVSFQGDDKPCLDIAEFFDAFSVVESADKDSEKGWNAVLKPYNENKYLKLGAFIFHSSLFGSTSAEDVLFTINSHIELEPRLKLRLLFHFWLNQCEPIANNLENSIKTLYSYVDSCCKTIIASDENEECQSLWQWMRDEICAPSDNCFASYILALVARGVAIAHNAEENKEEESSSDLEGWEKMNVDEKEHTSPPSYRDSCGDRNARRKSGDWETLWIDVEKWNLLVSQIQDCILVNAAISLGHAAASKASSEKEEKSVTPLNEQYKESVSVRDLLSNGPGYMAEVVSHSLCQLNIPATCVEKEKDEGASKHSQLSESQQQFVDFLHNVLFSKFPYSLAPDCLHAHSFWELVVEWNRDPMMISHLNRGIEHLKLVHGDTQARHGLALMSWKTFVAKRYAALLKLVEKVGKAPKDRLCRKEVSISDALMPQFCQACTDLLQVMADSEPVLQNARVKHATPMAAEDCWSNVEGKRSIMDIARGHAGANVDLIQHHMHATFILHATMEFLIRGVKPLSALFDQKSRSCLALDLTTKDPALPDTNATPAEVIKARHQFLRKVASGAVQKLAAAVNGEESPIMSCKEVKNEMESWLETVNHVAYEFQVEEHKIKLYVAEEMFRNGIDSLGLEICATITDKDVLATSLVIIIGQRISYILLRSSAEESLQMMTLMSTTLSTWIKSQDCGALKRPDVPIKDTAALAGHVLNMMSERNSLHGIAQSLKGLTASLSSR